MAGLLLQSYMRSVDRNVVMQRIPVKPRWHALSAVCPAQTSLYSAFP